MANLKKISAAVIVDGAYKEVQDAKGKKVREFQMRSPEEMKNIEAIVKKAIGYDEARGDQVEVINMPFNWSISEEDTKAMGGEWWKEYILISYKPLVSLILAVLFIFFVVRPLLKRRTPLPKDEAAYLPKMSTAQPAALPPEMPMARDGKPANLRQQTLQLVQENPSKVVGIIKEWINEKGENP